MINDDMNDDTIRGKTDLELEREELNLLVKQGIKFSVTHKIRRHKKGVKGFFQRPEVITVKEDFEIQEPTLSVLDRLSAIWVEMGLDEKTAYSRRNGNLGGSEAHSQR